MMAGSMIIGAMFFYILTRLWFIINVRDWRDELAAKANSADEIEMQTDRQVVPKPVNAQPSVPVGHPLYQADPNDVKAKGVQ